MALKAENIYYLALNKKSLLSLSLKGCVKANCSHELTYCAPKEIPAVCRVEPVLNGDRIWHYLAQRSGPIIKVLTQIYVKKKKCIYFITLEARKSRSMLTLSSWKQASKRESDGLGIQEYPFKNQVL